MANKLNYNYWGIVSKGEVVGIYMYTKIFKKVLNLVVDLGKLYEKNHCFDKDIIDKLGKPYELSKFLVNVLNVANKLGLTNIGWHKELKKNKAFDKRLNKPFI